MFLGKRKSGIYFIEFFDEHLLKTRRISTGSKFKGIALQFLKNFNNAKAVRDNKLPKILISQFSEEYLRNYGDNFSRNYRRSIKLSFRQLILSLGDISLKSIHVKEAQKFLSTVNSRAPLAASLYLRTLKAAFGKAIDWGYLTDNIFKNTKLPRPIKKIPYFLNENEIYKIIDVISESKIRNLFIFAFYTGMRLNEILNLKWRDVNLNEQNICIANNQSFTCKSRKDRIIPICLKVSGIIKEISNSVIHENQYVFVKFSDIKYESDYISKLFKKAVRKAGLSDEIHFHTLRHSFASNLVIKGASIYAVKELLGHENISTTQIYSHLTNESLRKAMSLLN